MRTVIRKLAKGGHIDFIRATDSLSRELAPVQRPPPPAKMEENPQRQTIINNWLSDGSSSFSLRRSEPETSGPRPVRPTRSQLDRYDPSAVCLRNERVPGAATAKTKMMIYAPLPKYDVEAAPAARQTSGGIRPKNMYAMQPRSQVQPQTQPGQFSRVQPKRALASRETERKEVAQGESTPSPAAVRNFKESAEKLSDPARPSRKHKSVLRPTRDLREDLPKSATIKPATDSSATSYHDVKCSSRYTPYNTRTMTDHRRVGTIPVPAKGANLDEYTKRGCYGALKTVESAIMEGENGGRATRSYCEPACGPQRLINAPVRHSGDFSSVIVRKDGNKGAGIAFYRL